MAVAGADSASMTDLGEIAVPTGPPCAGHHAVTGGHHRRTRIGGVISALVPPADAEHRMESRARKARGDPPELDRCAEERTSQGVPPGIVVRRATPGVEPERGE